MPDPQLVLIPNLEVQVFRASDLAVLDVIKARNLVPLVGRRMIRDLLLSPVFPTSFSVPGYMAVGSDGTTTTDGMTGLVVETFRKGLTRRLAQASGMAFQLFIDSSEGNGSGTQPLREAAIFDLIAGGGMLARATFSLINKTSSIQLVLNWSITLASS